ncbi:MAG: alanine:cation symporter family protein, partial [Myxococcota bacterium]
MNGIDATINAWVRPLADGLASFVFFEVPIAGAQLPLVVLSLAAGAFYFTFRFRFINIRGFTHALRLLREPPDPDHPGELSHFQALSTAISGTVGIGNIGGVAVAISLGGPGAA